MSAEAVVSEEKLAYDEVIDSRGLSVPFVPSIITPRIERPLRNGRYEIGERMFLEGLVREDDRVLDLGAGLGLVAATAAKLAPNGAVLSIEAQPDLLALIRETWTLNEVENAALRHGMIMPDDGPAATFFVRADFWASSFEPESRPYIREVEVPQIGLKRIIADFEPTVICCDVEGGEIGLFDAVDLSGVRAIVIETHPKAYGEPARDALLEILKSKGFVAHPQSRPSTVYVFERPEEVPKPTGAFSALPETWPPRDPRVLLATCMKDEGPFILEWLAWHKAIGVTDFVVFSNDCTDGTDRLLDRLDAMGEITHLPNPASFYQQTHFQPFALNFVQQMPVFREADFFLSTDVDEFINIRVGNGHITDLLAAVEPFDVLSMCELNHGSNNVTEFEAGWVTESFPWHDTPRPGKWRARAGVKSLTRLSNRVWRIRNHRPDLMPELPDGVWLDGSGQAFEDLSEDASLNGVDSRGKRELVSLEHFALRSLDSYLVKRYRGDVVVAGKQVSERYWRLRNRNEHLNHDLSDGIQRARDVYKRFETDTELMQRHNDCCTLHAERIAELKSDEEYQEVRARLAES
ncbi:MAG: FkbM family methyltransferase [Boseongicola sp.]|nr:FkbM family methyltransferase [Boseongicola sp.]MDD9977745.1 FkbM family methyltransferase [Boseongicola sp.]